MSRLQRTGAVVATGLAAAAVGFAAGFLVLLVIAGLSSADWIPVGQVGGAGLFAGAAIGLVARVGTRTAFGLALAGASAGAGLGFLMRAVGDLEWAVVSAALLALALATVGRALAEPTAQTD